MERRATGEQPDPIRSTEAPHAMVAIDAGARR